MNLLIFLVYQLFSYGILPWVTFGVLAFCCPRYLGRVGLLIGHFLISCAVVFFDVQWITAEMDAPGWNGLPDMDMVFYFGLLVRLALINAVLVPLSFGALRLRGPSKSKEAMES